jgi:hypothetical protein
VIAKGVTHRDGAILAGYLVTGKGRECAELWELRGFACTGIVAAFRSVHVMAAATKCTAPFFHLSVRNRAEERLDRSQWEYVANAIERMLGLTDQPRAVAFHTAEETGHSHMHIAWSRIDQETLTAKPLPFFGHRLKQVCRQLEEHFGLKPVPNNRASAIRFAPTRAEDEQARRLQVDVHATRETIRNCFDRSDCARSFRDALAQEGFVLARGDRRDFLIVDGAGGIHALGKRILGVSAAEIRDRLADLPADLLPTLEQARAFLGARQQARPIPETVGTPNHEVAVRNPVQQVKTRRRARHEKRRAEGKKTRLGTDRIEPPAVNVIVPLVCIDPPCPPAAEVSIEGEKAPIDQPSNGTSETPGTAAQGGEFMRLIDGLQELPGGASAFGEIARLEPVTRSTPEIEQPPVAYKTPGHAARLRDQFRALVKQLTAKVLAPRPTSRKRRRAGSEMIGAFRLTARAVFRPIVRLPIVIHATAFWEDTLSWLHTWVCDDLTHTYEASDDSSEHDNNNLSLHL